MRRASSLLLGSLTLILALPPSAGTSARPTPVAPPERLGPVWPIAEEDLRTVILRRFQEQLPEIRQRFEESLATHRVPFTPRPTTDTARTILIDPSITIDTDIPGPNGKLLAKAGDRVNPLATLPLRRLYLVINGADPRQLAWASREIQGNGTRPVMVLLTEGNLQDAAAALPPGIKLFPAPAALFVRFPIDSVPARLKRAGTRMQLDFIGEHDLP